MDEIPFERIKYVGDEVKDRFYKLQILYISNKIFEKEICQQI